jgi:hypothetical protein
MQKKKKLKPKRGVKSKFSRKFWHNAGGEQHHICRIYMVFGPIYRPLLLAHLVVKDGRQVVKYELVGEAGQEWNCVPHTHTERHDVLASANRKHMVQQSTRQQNYDAYTVNIGIRK